MKTLNEFPMTKNRAAEVAEVGFVALRQNKPAQSGRSDWNERAPQPVVACRWTRHDSSQREEFHHPARAATCCRFVTGRCHELFETQKFSHAHGTGRPLPVANRQHALFALIGLLITLVALPARAGSISGRVQSGAGFGGLFVGNVPIRIQSGAVNIVTNTDAVGYYFVTNLPDSTIYNVTCLATGQNLSPLSQLITLAAGSPGNNATNVNFTNSISLSGRVLGANGTPAPGVTVHYRGPTAPTSAGQIALDFLVAGTNGLPNIDMSDSGGTPFFAGFTNLDNFGISADGQINVAATGTYQFHLTSDDGSVLRVNGRTVINHDGLHGESERSGSVVLPPGTHTVSVIYFEAAGGARLKLDWTPPGLARQLCTTVSGWTVGGYDLRPRILTTATTAADGSFSLPNQRIFGPMPLSVMQLAATNTGYTLSSALTVTNGGTNYNFTVTASAPTLTVAANVGTTEDAPVVVPFTVGDLQTAPGSLTVSAVSTNQIALVNNLGLVLGGSGANRTLTITPLPGATGSTTLRLTVSDGTSTVTNLINLVVTSANDAPVAGAKLGLVMTGPPARGNADGLALGNSSFTVEFWARRAVINQWGIAASQATFGIQNQALHLGFRDNNKFTFGFFDNDLDTVAAYTDTNWHHWAATYNVTNGDRRIYRDGQLVANDVTTNAFGGAGQIQFNVGYVGFNPAYSWNGGLDDMRVWNHARTDFDINRLRLVPLTGRENGLLAYWRMDENDGQVLRDSSGNGKDVQLLNWPAWARGTSAPGFNAPIIPEDSTNSPVFLPGYDAETINIAYTNVTVSTGTLNRTSGVITNATHNPLLYTPPANFTGSVALTFIVLDASGLRDTNTFFLSVQPANDLPTIATLSDRVILENTVLGPLAIAVNDPDNDPAALVFSARSSDQTIVADAGLVTGGAGTNRSLTITPVSGESGTTIITLSVFDGFLTTETTFQLRVEPQPAYKIFDLGALPNRSIAVGVAVNDLGAAAANASANLAGQSLRAFINEGLDSGGAITDAGVLGSTTSQGAGLNNLGELIGTSPDGSGNEKAFLRGRVQSVVVSTNVPFPGFTNVVTNIVTTFAMNSLGTLGGAKSWGTAVNDDGVAVGYSEAAGGAVRAFIRTNGPTLTALGPLTGFTSSNRAFSVNLAGQVAGASYNGALAQATLWTLNSTQALGFLPGGNSSVGHAMNAFAVVVGNSTSSNGTRAFRWQSGVMTSLGALPNAVSSEARAVNGFGQVAGFSRVNNADRATLHSAGFLYDLNELISEDDAGWNLQQALAINARGDIVGVGETNGQRRAFLAIPANVIGRKLTRPAGTVASVPPTITLLNGASGDTAGNSFLRSAATQKSYAVRPVVARISWPTTTDVLDTSSPPVVVVSANVWPRVPQVHIAGAPVEFNPAVAGFAHIFQALLYVTNGANVDGGTKVFSATQPGWTVAHFLQNNGQPANPQTQPPYLEVVRTFTWNDPRVLVDNVPTTIGQPVTSAFHRDHAGRNGWVIFERAPYDGAGLERAHDRATREGPLLPVNIDTSSAADDLAIVWYATNSIRVAWAYQPVRYAPQWPVNPPEIVIASTLGSGSLTPAIYGTTLRAYHQPDVTLPGFNPNEEHALLLPANGGGGSALFALRDDLNRFRNHSQPFALLKYIEPASLEWRIQPFKVLQTNAQYQFRYEGTAGNEIAPPYPLSILNLCDNSYGVSGPHWEDYNGKLYARAAGLGPDLHALITARWWYPLQPGFFYDLDSVSDGVNDLAVGACVGWLEKRTNNNSAQLPVDVAYDIHWPDAPVLQIGETLINPKRGLPGVRNWASAEVIWDSAITNGQFFGNDLLSSSARLFDPLTPRSVTAPAGFALPAAIKTTPRDGKLFFTDLPSDLGSRLSYESFSRKLTWEGYLDAAVAGEPLLLLNVMSARERDRILALDGENNNSAFDQLVEALYAKTRNPNGVDLDDDGEADGELRVGLTTDDDGNVILEPLLADKALTAAVGSAPPASFAPGNALQFDGANDHANLGGAVALDGVSFAIEFWVKRNATGTEQYLMSQGVAAPFAGFVAGFRADNRFTFSFHETGVDLPLVTSAGYADTDWHHWAVTFNTSSRQRVIFRDGVAVASDTAGAGYTGTGLTYLGRGLAAHYFNGQIDDVRIWNQPRTAFTVAKDRNKRLLGTEGGLLRYFLCDETGGTTLTDASGTANGTLVSGVTRVTSTAPTGALPRFLTLAENNDEELGLPVSLHVIRVDDGPFVGDLKVLPPSNVFDEKLPIRHSSDFAAEPERVAFEWYYKPDQADLDPTELPTVDPVSGNIIDPRGWLVFTSYTPASGAGVNYVTLGDGGQSSLLTLGDNYFICRYRGLAVNGVTNWSDWAGDPSGGGTPRAALAEGWIKRVIRGLNPFDQRVADFHSDEVNTFASMLIQAGQRYEGDIAFNPDGDAINSVGLIEAYETVLRRGRRLSIEGTPAVNFDAANNALLLVSTKIADLYMLLGNESYADAADPTIGFGVGQGEYGTAATSIFAFQNQLDSLLEEELVLLRGRDDRNAGVAAPPVYNRLFWNFTLAEGELAYQQVYNINDFTVDGFIDERDARLMYPQGHGDAWGHYLTGIKKYYELLRHPNFTWIPRTERVSVNGVAVEVDFLDERKFARVAAARAKTGGEIMNLTYRFNYVDDPDGQWQGYKDSNRDRAWGVTEWARRAGQGALFDWMVANAILPATDANTNHVGITKIDRTTVLELREVASAITEIQGRMDQSDVGLNPVGVAKGAVPFDIDPALFQSGLGFQGQTHFEQIYARALKAVNNAVKVWDEANKFSSLLRRNQDDVDSFIPNIRDQELDFRNQLIEIFGYPYSGDIGPGKTYPAGHDGPDLYHYMYVKTDEITGEKFPPGEAITAFYTRTESDDPHGFYPGVSEEFREGSDPVSLEITSIPVSYPQVAGSYTFQAPDSWGSRRAPGELQEALSEVVAAEARVKVALQNYDGVILDAEDMVFLLQAQHDLNTEKITVINNKLNKIEALNFTIAGLKAGQIVMRRIAEEIDTTSEIITESIPKVVGVASDVTAPGRAIVKAIGSVSKSALESTADGLEGAENFIEAGKDLVEIRTDLSLETAEGDFEVLQRVKELEKQLREEYIARLEVYIAREELLQAQGRYKIALARGERLLEELLLFRKRTAAETTEQRYEDMTFRIFRNDALQKYRASFDLAARYVYLAANAYEYELGFLGTDARSGSEFLTDIIRQRSLGQIIENTPIVGLNGLADPLGRLAANFEVLKPQLGLNNPQFEDSRFSLRHELFRINDGPDGDAVWREQLQKARVANLWDLPEFRRYCRPFTTESAGAQPALVFRFPTTVSFGQNFFGRNLGPGDSGYDPSVFSTKIAGAGVWFTGAGSGLSQTPRVYFFPSGLDVLRSPTGNDLKTREWRVLDQAVPIPFPIGASDLNDPTFNPTFDSLSGAFTDIRRYSSMRAYHDQGVYSDAQTTSDTRLIGRSVWNTEWILVIPGGSLLFNANSGLDTFVNTVDDIKIYFRTYSYSGN